MAKIRIRITDWLVLCFHNAINSIFTTLLLSSMLLLHICIINIFTQIMEKLCVLCPSHGEVIFLTYWYLAFVRWYDNLNIYELKLINVDLKSLRLFYIKNWRLITFCKFRSSLELIIKCVARYNKVLPNARLQTLLVIWDDVLLYQSTEEEMTV